MVSQHRRQSARCHTYFPLNCSSYLLLRKRALRCRMPWWHFAFNKEGKEENHSFSVRMLRFACDWYLHQLFRRQWKWKAEMLVAFINPNIAISIFIIRFLGVFTANRQALPLLHLLPWIRRNFDWSLRIYKRLTLRTSTSPSAINIYTHAFLLSFSASCSHFTIYMHDLFKHLRVKRWLCFVIIWMALLGALRRRRCTSHRA